MKYRIEDDILGNVRVPADAYYGSETERAKENFQVSGLQLQKEFIYSYVILKKAAILANTRLGKLDARKSRAMARACDEILKGKLDGQFVLDAFQAGAGTSTNMNVNEVIANRAIELLGGKKGDYKRVHPNDDVNMAQSTNDTFHTATHIAAYTEIRGKLLPALSSLEKSLAGKEREFKNIVKIGRTHLQDAVPITLGQEFSGYKGALASAAEDLMLATNKLLEIPAGGTATGTGINAPRGFASAFVKELRKLTRVDFRQADNNFAVMQNQIAELAVGNALEEVAIVLNKVANDLRLLSSGPRAGFGELLLPEVQPGSSIMPGKINPSMPEMLNMVCFRVMGNSATVREAANAGQLELNVFMPIITFVLLYSIRILSSSIATFDKKCIRGIKVNAQRIRKSLSDDLGIATALSPYIGYAKAAQISRKAYREGKSVMQVCIELKILDKKKLEKALDPRNLV